MPQTSNPFQEGQYPSAITGMVRGFDIALLESRRKKAEDEKQREEFMMAIMEMQREQEEAQQQQAWREEQEKARQERAMKGFATWEEKRAWDLKQAELAGGRRLEEIELRKKPTKVPKPGALTDIEKTFISGHRKDIADASRIRKEIEGMFDSPEKSRLTERVRRIEARIDRDRVRVEKILGTGEQGPAQPATRPTRQQGDYTMTAPDGEIITSEPQLVAWFVSHGKSQKEINAAVKDWRSKGGR